MATVLAENPVSELTSRFLERAGNLWIDGQWRAARLGETFDVYNPATGEIIAHCAAGDKADIDAAVHAARRAFDSGPWSRMTPSERGRLIWKLGDLVEEHGDELAELETLDNGKPLAVARAADVPLAVNLFRYMAGWATKIHGQTIPISVRRQRIFQLHYPRADRRGRADHPLELSALDGRLEARSCPGGGLHRCAQAGRADAAQRAQAGGVDRGSGLPGGRRQYRYGTGRDGRRGAGRPSRRRQDRLHRLDGGRPPDRRGGRQEQPQKGHARTGRQVAQHHSGRRRSERSHPRRGQRYLLQPRPVLLRGSRLYVQNSVYDEVVEGVAHHAREIRVGSGFDAATQMGPLVSQEQLERVCGYIDAGLRDGAQLAAGGKRLGERGYFVEPTVFAGTRQSMKIVREEIFGPVVAAMPFDDPDEVLPLANDSTYGLAAAVWTRDISKAHRLARRLKAGTVWINCYNVFDAALPFGGYKESGWGREMGLAAVELVHGGEGGYDAAGVVRSAASAR